MPKLPAARMTDTLNEVDAVNPDIGRFLRFCLYNAGTVDGVWGPGYLHVRNNKTAQEPAAATNLALGAYAIHSDANKEIRRLRRAHMLLKFVVNDTAMATTATATKGQSAAQLRQSLNAYWAATLRTEIEFLIGNVCDSKTRQMVSQALMALPQLDQDALFEELSTGLYPGVDSMAKFRGDARAAWLLLKRLNVANPYGGTRAWVGARKPTILNDVAAELKIKIRHEASLVRDRDPENVALQLELNNFIANPLTFMQSVSVHAQDGIVPAAADWTVTDMDALGLPTVARMGFVMRTQNERGALELVNIDSTTRGSEMYFLPWFSKRLIKLNIPAGAGPGIFFTAAINGCSVFITGTAQSPTIYHGGIDGSLHTGYTSTAIAELHTAATTKNAARFWREMLKHLEGLNDGQILGEVNKNHYVLRTFAPIPVSPVCALAGKNIQTTTRSRAFETTFTGQVGLTAKYCSPWGCVFGVRALNGDWSFYLQENVTIVYENPAGIPWGTCRPICISRIFPGNGAIQQASPSRYANVNPSNHVVVWDGTATPVPAPFVASRYVFSPAPFAVPTDETQVICT